MTKLTERFVIGRIGKPHGLNGELRIWPLTDRIERFNDLKFCYIEDQAGNIKDKLEITGCRIIHSQVNLRFKNVTDRTAAEKLKNYFLSVDRLEAIELSENSYFIADLIGCEVYDGEKGYLGKVVKIQKNTGRDVVIVNKDGKKDLLYPNSLKVVQKIDLDKKRIDVELPKGLYEIYR